MAPDTLNAEHQGMPAPRDRAAGRAHTMSGALARDPQVALALRRMVVRQGRAGRLQRFGLSVPARPGDVVVGWGRKANTRRGVQFARKADIPFWCLEDGFIGYLDHPARDPRRLSLIIDQRGIYYDAGRESDLEHLLLERDWFTPHMQARAEAVIERIKAAQISKYNHAPARLPASVAGLEGAKVLVVDQTRGDMSIKLGGAGPQDFDAMLAAALRDHPSATIVLKVHPDVLVGRKKGHFDLAALPERVLVVAEDCAPQTLLADMDAVYVVTSQYGFEALLADKPVHVFGQPFYAGWGLTEDHGGALDRRQGGVSLLELAAAALIAYPTYLDPFRGEVTEIEVVLDYLEAERAMPRLSGKRVFPLGFSIWKRGFLRAYCRQAQSYRPITTRALEVIKWSPGDAVLVWGRKQDALVAGLPPEVEVWRMEDGFLRSSGLGSDLARPASLAFDQRGIYYDATAPSDLEYFLKTHSFSPSQLARGRALMTGIRARGVSKYNIGETGAPGFRERAGDRPVILVPGQVEDDASIRLGAVDVNTNRKLLAAVRARNPDAYIVYKPHPDVLARNRMRDAPEESVSTLCDEQVEDIDIIACFDAVDEVHVMTSLSGFEALLRGLKVVCYGRPFYAGWGLTRDQQDMPRRNRQLPLEAVVYGLLCVYARSVQWPSGVSTTPECLIDALAAARQRGGIRVQSPFQMVRQFLRKAGFFLQTMLR